jgi:polyisoprenoid-binding protein YceI
MVPTRGEYAIDPARSTVTFRTRHLFGLGAVRGTFRLREGWIRVDEPAAASATRAVVAADSIATGNANRDRAVTSNRYLDAGRYPDITFASTELARAEAGWVLHGTLTARGRSAPVELAVEQVTADGGEVRLRATCRVDRYAFGVDAGRGLAARHLALRLDVTANRA